MNMEKLKKNLLIGCTGSVATIKLPAIINLFTKHLNLYEFNVKIILTENAKHFVDFGQIPREIEIYTDEDEWQMWSRRGDPILHIDLIKWADIMLIAPLDANSLAKMAQGICDNLLLCTARAWDMQKLFFFCPAMNTKMWDHPVTSQHINILKSWGYQEVPCISKALMCGDTGTGAMATPESIHKQIIQMLKGPITLK